MSISMHEAVGEMKLTTLTDLSTQKLQQHGWKEALDDRHAADILRRALVEQRDEAWSELQQCFSEFIRKWIRSHPSRDVALLRDSEENYIAQTFSRFWYAVRNQDLEFTTGVVTCACAHEKCRCQSQGSPTKLALRNLWRARVCGRAFNLCS